MTIKVGDKIKFITSRMDPSGIEVFAKAKTGTVEKLLHDESGEAYAVRYKGRVHIILDAQVKP